MTPTATETGSPAGSRPVTLSVSDIEPLDGLNPRAVDTKAPQFQELDREAKARASHHRINLELGSRLRKDLARPKFDMPAARLLAELVLAHDESGLAMRSCYVDSDLHTELWRQTKAQKAADEEGTLKVEPGPRENVREALRAELDKAKTPQAVLGVLLRHLIAARFSNDTVTVQSKRNGTTMPGIGYGYYGSAQVIEGLIDQLAIDAGVLPEPLRDEVEKRAKESASG